MTEYDVHRGNALAPGEAIIWGGTPAWRRVARDVFHLPGVAVYFVLLFGLDAYQAWAKDLPAARAVHDSVPLAVITCAALAILAVLAWLTGRTTRYTITDRRVILHYGIAMPATLSLPFSQIVGLAVSVAGDHTGDIALVLREGNRMPFLKLWPHARPWRMTRPEPMLRAVPRAAVVSGLLTRALQTAEQAHAARAADVDRGSPALVPQLASA